MPPAAIGTSTQGQGHARTRARKNEGILHFAKMPVGSCPSGLDFAPGLTGSDACQCQIDAIPPNNDPASNAPEICASKKRV